MLPGLKIGAGMMGGKEGVEYISTSGATHGATIFTFTTQAIGSPAGGMLVIAVTAQDAGINAGCWGVKVDGVSMSYANGGDTNAYTDFAGSYIYYLEGVTASVASVEVTMSTYVNEGLSISVFNVFGHGSAIPLETGISGGNDTGGSMVVANDGFGIAVGCQRNGGAGTVVLSSPDFTEDAPSQNFVNLMMTAGHFSLAGSLVLTCSVTSERHFTYAVWS